jgi:hypothetical protein
VKSSDLKNFKIKRKKLKKIKKGKAENSAWEVTEKGRNENKTRRR